MAATEALQILAEAARQEAKTAIDLATKSSESLDKTMQRLEKSEEAIAQVKEDFRAFETKINKDCDTAISKAGEAVQKIGKLEGDVTTLQVNIKEIQEDSARVQAQIQSLDHKTESRLDRLEETRGDEPDLAVRIGKVIGPQILQEANLSCRRSRLRRTRELQTSAQAMTGSRLHRYRS